jgi:hypothetical protein
MPRQVTITSGKKDVVLPNGLRYQAGAVVVLSDQQYSGLSASFKSTYLSADTTVSGSLALQAATPVAGFALQNATPTILTWTAPNDGALHRVLLMINLHVTSAETGGSIGVTIPLPDGSSLTPTINAGGFGAGVQAYTYTDFVKAGGTTTFSQTGALTGGAATVWAEIWGS